MPADLWQSAATGDVESLKRCLQDQRLDIADRRGQTPLMHAAEHGQLAAVEFLLEHGSNPNARDAESMTPLMWAVQYDGPIVAEVISKIVRHGGDVNARDDLGQTPAIAAMSCGFRNLVAIAALARHGADLDLATYDDETALTYAIVWNSLPAVRLLLAAGANPNWRGANGGTPLRYALDTLSDATEDEMDEVVRLLFEFGATPDMGEDFSDSSLACALRTRRERVSRRVLSKVTRLSDEQRTEAIQLAEQRGLHSIANQLRYGGSDSH